MPAAPPLRRPDRLAFAMGVAKEHVPRPPRRVVLGQVLRISRVALKGSAVACPACGAQASGFFRTRCPSCSAAPRQRLIALFLEREVGAGSGKEMRILHFAPEPGLIRMLSAAPGVDYVPADLVPDKGHAQVDATDIRLAPDFDGVITSHVLEHIPDDRAAMREMFRILRPGGWALVIVPVDASLQTTYEDPAVSTLWGRHRHFGQHDHVRVYGRDVVARLEEVGFDVAQRSYAQEIGVEEAARYGLRSQDVILFCQKPAA